MLCFVGDLICIIENGLNAGVNPWMEFDGLGEMSPEKYF